MGYPDTFEGFMINSQADWTTFKKQEVRQGIAYEYCLFPIATLTSTAVQTQEVRTK
jgi:hypothetical protein